MRVSPAIATAALTIGLVGACAPPLLAPDDRIHVCQVAVYEKFGSPVFHANQLSSPTGGLAGAARGALWGLAQPSVYAWIITVPLGAVIGAVGGTACAVASQSHPNAEADFEKILKAADVGKLTRALESNLNGARAGCAPVQAGASAAPVPDTIIEIEKVDVTMGCAFGNQRYWFTLKWRALAATNNRVLVETTTRCSQTSFHEIDDWFAKPEEARVEIENLLNGIGRRMAADLLSPKASRECNFQSGETGEIEEK